MRCNLNGARVSYGESVTLTGVFFIRSLIWIDLPSYNSARRASREARISRGHKISRLNEYRVTASLTKLVRTPGFRSINSTYTCAALSFPLSPFRFHLVFSHRACGRSRASLSAARPIGPRYIGMRSTRGIAYGRNADDRRWKNGRVSRRREPVVKLSSLICAYIHTNFGALSFKIADGDARGETLERARRPASRHRRPYIPVDRESLLKKIK